ncbi:TetR/AcrR family transcriptional regulator C-terminal domain-containing protein [Kitasatospora nipponensis]|uniref:TetR/AcrR family transcriptional regulator C-terminal domain-containing protein n=1 Tax=Kitasatospora nipponensis TaxID=258049 RepID=UPI0031D30116
MAGTRTRSTTRAGLTRPKVLAAALELVDREGVERLSMRRLGSALGVEAMTLYHYLPNKAALLDGLVELVVSAVRPGEPSGPPPGWQEGLRAFATALRAELLRHPAVIPLVATRPVHSAAALAVVEETAQRLVRAGFTPLLALRLVNAVATTVTGHCLAEAASTPVHPEESAGPAPDLTGLPVLGAAAAAGLGTPEDHQARFALLLDALLDGLTGHCRSEELPSP